MLNRFLIINVVLFVSIAIHAQSQYKNITLPKPKGNQFNFEPCEPSIVIDPLNENHILAGAILDLVYESYDGGKTWKVNQIKSEKHGVYGDPTLISSPFGDLFYLHLGDPSHQGWKGKRLLESIVIQRILPSKESESIQFTDGIAIGTNPPKDQDKQWACTSRDGQFVYVTWTEFDAYESKSPKDHSKILFSAGNREGECFSKPILLSDVMGGCMDDDETTEGAVPAAGLMNQVYVAWAHQENIYFNKSLDNGRTWLKKSRIIQQIPGGWNQEILGVYRANGMPVLVSDIGKSKHAGNLYLCWSDSRTNDVNVYVSVSSDEGETWNEPVKVNQDTGGREQFFPWIAVDQITGYLYVVYYDRRNYIDAKTDVYLSTSTDGGKTWSDERISEASFTPNAYYFLGDYNNISAHNGVVRPIWTIMDAQGGTQVVTALIQK